MEQYRKQAASVLAGFMWLASIAGCGEDAPPAALPAPAAIQPDTTPRVDFLTFHATGELPCRTSTAAPPGQCDFGVRRESGGNAIVTITKPDGGTRSISFENGEPRGYDMNSGNAGEFSGSAEGGLFIVTIGPERYEIPKIVVLGE